MPFPETLHDWAEDAHVSILNVSRLRGCDRGLRVRVNPGFCRRFFSALLFLCIFPQLLLTGCTSSLVHGGSSSAAGAGSLQVSPGVISFGSVVVGQTATSTVSLANPGSAAVEISSVTISGQSFSVTGAANLPITVAAGATYRLSVAFSPTVLGAAIGQLTISSNSSSLGALAVSLSGTGAATNTAALSGFSCASDSFTGPATANCGVTMSAAAGNGGVTVVLASSNSAVAVPATVMVAAGSTSANFTATVDSVSSPQTATLTASAGGVSESVALQLGTAGAALSASASSVDFGNVNINTTASQQLTLTSSGSSPVTISSVTVAGIGFAVSGFSAPQTLNPNQSLTLNVQFDPSSAGAVTGQLTIASDASGGATTTIALSGAGTILILPTLSSLSCASSSLTGSATDPCTVALSGPAPAGGISVNLQSSSGAVTVPASVLVAAGASQANFTATAIPVSAAQTVTLSANAGAINTTFLLQLSASSPQLNVGAATLNFGDVALNTPATQTVTLLNSSAAPITVSLATVTGAGFSLAGGTFPVTLAAGQATPLAVQFDPAAAGSSTGSLTIISTSLTNPAVVVSLSGTGVLSLSYEVNLNWDAPSNSTDPVANYNVYRSADGGYTYQVLNPSPLPVTQTAYNDTNVQEGQSYDYYVESLDASGVASSPSNLATASIP